MLNHDLVIIGGGPAGLAAAIAAKESGIDDILILDREEYLGGILIQCIHNGFGLHTFKEELTGPEYAQRFVDKVDALGIVYKTNTMVINITDNKIIYATNLEEGLLEIEAHAIILAMGCRERARGALTLPGARCSGILTAGAAQKFVNLQGYMPGKEVVVLGSGDIGLIMARRMVFEGAKVKAVIELLPYSGGLRRNIVQCLDDYDIPLKLSHTIVDIHGKDRLTGITIAKVDNEHHPLLETSEHIPCDTLLLSVGLIPENELSTKAKVTLSPITGGPVVNNSFSTNKEGIFACGNVLHVHDLVDYVTLESYEAGKHAAEYIKNHTTSSAGISLHAMEGIRYTIPQFIDRSTFSTDLIVRFRVNDIFKDAYISVYLEDKLIIHKKKRILTPGEMVEIQIPSALLSSNPSAKNITFKVERS